MASFLTVADFPMTARYICWAFYVVFSLTIFGISIYMPEDVASFSAEVQKLKLIILCERMAARTALADLLPEMETSDDTEFIDILSTKVPDIESLDEWTQSIISGCLDPSKTFSSSRETNVTIGDLNVEASERDQLESITRQLVSLSSYMFGGKDFTAKLYLRARKSYCRKK